MRRVALMSIYCLTRCIGFRLDRRRQFRVLGSVSGHSFVGVSVEFSNCVVVVLWRQTLVYRHNVC